jgi:hypothetical protein
MVGRFESLIWPGFSSSPASWISFPAQAKSKFKEQLAQKDILSLLFCCDVPYLRMEPWELVGLKQENPSQVIAKISTNFVSFSITVKPNLIFSVS